MSLHNWVFKLTKYPTVWCVDKFESNYHILELNEVPFDWEIMPLNMYVCPYSKTNTIKEHEKR